MNPAIEGYTAAVVEPLDAPSREAAASDVAAFDVLVQRDSALRGALTDVAIPDRARRAVVAELLEGKVGAAARRLCAYAAGAVHGPEVPGAISWVAHRLRVDAGGEEPAPLGHLAARRRVGGYAACVFEDVDTSELLGIEDELFRFARTVAAAPALRSALGDRDLPTAVRRGVADELLRGKVHRATLSLVDYAIEGGRARDIVGTLDWLVEQTAVARGWRVARVRAGQDVDAGERQKLERTLSALAGAPVELQVSVDPVLLAGVDVEIGDLRLDATARARLDRLREHVTAGGWTDAGFGRRARGAEES